MNLKLINLFERDVGYPLRYIDYEKFIYICKEKKLINKYFNNIPDALEIINFLKQNQKLEKFCKIFEMSLSINKSQRKIDSIFSRYTETKDRKSLINSINELITSENIFDITHGFLYGSLGLEDQDLNIYYSNVLSGVNQLFNTAVEIDISRESYNIVCNILDIVLRCKYLWERKYNENIEVSNLDMFLDKLHNFEFEVFERGEYLSLDIPPESLGFLDITLL